MLSAMVAAGEDELICDFAETYHIFEWRGLPARYAAVLAFGLRDDSRIKMKMSGTRVDLNTLISAITADAVNLLVWFQSKDGAKKRNRPASVLDMITGKTTKKAKDIQTFTSAEAFERKRKQILEGN